MAFSYFATYTYYRELKGQLVTEKEFASTGRSFSCPIREKYLDNLKKFILQSLSGILREIVLRAKINPLKCFERCVQVCFEIMLKARAVVKFSG